MALSDVHLDVGDIKTYLSAATSFLKIHLNAQLVLTYDYRVSNSWIKCGVTIMKNYKETMLKTQ